MLRVRNGIRNENARKDEYEKADSNGGAGGSQGRGKPGWREGRHDSPATLRPADLIVFPPRPAPGGTAQQGVSGLLGRAARGMSLGRGDRGEVRR